MEIEKYPDQLFGDECDNFDFVYFDGGASYAEDIKDAEEHIKKEGGVLYTTVDDEGNKVFYNKGLTFCDRLGHVVMKIKEGKANIYKD